MTRKAAVILFMVFCMGGGYCFAGQPAAAGKLGSANRAEVVTAIRTLARDDSPESTAALAGLLKRSNDTYIKVQAIEALTLHRSTAALAAIAAALDDPVPQVRQSAVINLGYFGDDQKVVPVIEKTLKNESNPEVSISAVNTLGIYKSSRAVEAIDAVLSNRAADKRLRFHAAHELEMMGTKEAGNRLSKYGSDADPEVRKAARKEPERSGNQGKRRSQRNNRQ